MFIGRAFLPTDGAVPYTGRCLSIVVAMIIPLEQLSQTAVDNLIENYCTQAGWSDSGGEGVADACEQVMQALRDKKLLIIWSMEKEEAYIQNAAQHYKALSHTGDA